MKAHWVLRRRPPSKRAIQVVVSWRSSWSLHRKTTLTAPSRIAQYKSTPRSRNRVCFCSHKGIFLLGSSGILVHDRLCELQLVCPTWRDCNRRTAHLCIVGRRRHFSDPGTGSAIHGPDADFERSTAQRPCASCSVVCHLRQQATLILEPISQIAWLPRPGTLLNTGSAPSLGVASSYVNWQPCGESFFNIFNAMIFNKVFGLQRVRDVYNCRSRGSRGETTSGGAPIPEFRT